MDLLPNLSIHTLDYARYPRENEREGYENLEKAILENETDEIACPGCLPAYMPMQGFASKMGKKRKAHQYCKKAHKLSPEEPESLLIEGRIYIEEGDYDKGIKQWAKALNCSPTADTWNEIGMHSMEIGYLDYAKISFNVSANWNRTLMVSTRS